MRVSRTYGGNHFKGEEMDSTPLLLTIDDVSVKEFDSNDGKAAKDKIVLAFRESDKTMVVNFTNANIIAGFLGDETDDWVGQKIVVFRDKTRFGSKVVPCVSVRQPKSRAEQTFAKAAPSLPSYPDPAPVRRRVEPLTQAEADAPDDDGVAANDSDIPY